MTLNRCTYVYSSEEELYNSFNKQKTRVLLISCDANFYVYQLIQLENICHTIDLTCFEVVLILGKGIENNQVRIIHELYPFVKLIKLESITYLSDLKSSYRNSWVGSECLVSRFFSFCLVPYFEYTVCLDTDILILKDPFTLIDKLDKSADAYARYSFAHESSWPRYNYRRYIEMGLLDPSCRESDFYLLNAGFVILKQSFTSVYSPEELKAELLKVTRLCAESRNPISGDAVFSHLLQRFKYHCSQMPDGMHVYLSDFAVYAERGVNPTDICCIHFADSKSKIWSNLGYLRTFPQYAGFVQSLADKIGALTRTISKGDVNSLSDIQEKLQLLMSNGSIDLDPKTILRSHGLLQTYQELLPVLIEKISGSPYFYMSDTLSEDRLILWSRQLPWYFRCDIAPSGGFFRTKQQQITSRDAYTRQGLHVVVRLSIRGGNSWALPFTESDAYRFFEEMRKCFPNSDLHVDSALIYVRILTDTAEFPTVLERLTAFIEHNYDTYMKL